MRRTSSSDNDDEGWKIFELILQAIAIALSALILLNMHIESTSRVPSYICTDESLPTR